MGPAKALSGQTSRLAAPNRAKIWAPGQHLLKNLDRKSLSCIFWGPVPLPGDWGCCAGVTEKHKAKLWGFAHAGVTRLPDVTVKSAINDAEKAAVLHDR